MKSLLSLLKAFYAENGDVVWGAAAFQCLFSVIIIIVLPNVITKIVKSTRSSEELRRQLLKVTLLLLFVAGLATGKSYFQMRLYPRLSQFVSLYLVDALFKKHQAVGDLGDISVLIDKIDALKTSIHNLAYFVFAHLIPRCIALLIACGALFLMNGAVGAVFTSFLGAQVVSVLFTGRCIDAGGNTEQLKSNVCVHLEDIFRNGEVVRTTHGAHNNELHTFKNLNDIVVDSENAINRCTFKYQLINYGLIFAMVLSTFYVIYKENKAGRLSGEHTTQSILMVLAAVSAISDVLLSMPDVVARIGAIYMNEAFLNDIVKFKETAEPPREKPASFDIAFRGVHFAYPSTEHALLENLTLTIPEGALCAVYGPSGSGKSTMMRMIYGLEKPTRGDVTIGGLKPVLVQPWMCFIVQNTLTLFRRSIYENITYGMENVSVADVEREISQFNLQSVFGNLNEDYLLRADATKLSGGQKKVVHLIRAKMKSDSRIILLDEPSTGLDEESRDKVLEFIKSFRALGKTCIVITHDPKVRDVCSSVISM